MKVMTLVSYFDPEQDYIYVDIDGDGIIIDRDGVLNDDDEDTVWRGYRRWYQILLHLAVLDGKKTVVMYFPPRYCIEFF